jgi:hypothetical protein
VWVIVTRSRNIGGVLRRVFRDGRLLNPSQVRAITAILDAMFSPKFAEERRPEERRL